MSNKLKLLLAGVVAMVLLALVMRASREEGTSTPSAASMPSTNEPYGSAASPNSSANANASASAEPAAAPTESANQDDDASTDESPSGPTALEARQRELEAIYGRAPVIDAELEEALRNPPPPILPGNWDKILANPPELPPEVVEVLNNPPQVEYDPEVERIFRERPEVEIPKEVQYLIDNPTPVPPPPLP